MNKEVYFSGYKLMRRVLKKNERGFLKKIFNGVFIVFFGLEFEF